MFLFVIFLTVVNIHGYPGACKYFRLKYYKNCKNVYQVSIIYKIEAHCLSITPTEGKYVKKNQKSVFRRNSSSIHCYGQIMSRFSYEASVRLQCLLEVLVTLMKRH